MYLIAEQDVLSEQALNSKIFPAHFLLSTYEVSNKHAGTKQQILPSLLAPCLSNIYIRVGYCSSNSVKNVPSSRMHSFCQNLIKLPKIVLFGLKKIQK